MEKNQSECRQIHMKYKYNTKIVLNKLNPLFNYQFLQNIYQI